MHYHLRCDAVGDVVEAVPYCSDACHREGAGDDYGGWNGCQEGGDYPEWCNNCGVFAGGTPECEHQATNVVVNRFASTDGERCECGNWIQLPA